jgi:hypothetical protein
MADAPNVSAQLAPAYRLLDAARNGAGEVSRAVALQGLNLVNERTFERGIKADGTPAGNYSPSYRELRAKRNWQRSARIIFTATTQLRNAHTVGEVDGGHGVGFTGGARDGKEETNGDIARKLEQTYGLIWSAHTEEEQQALGDYADDLITEQLSNVN